MKKTILNCLISIFLIAFAQGMDDKPNNFEGTHSNNYVESNDFGDLNQLLIGSKIKKIDAHVRTKKISNTDSTIYKNERIDPHANSDCLFYCFGFCCKLGLLF